MSRTGPQEPDDHEEFLKTLPSSGMFITSGRSWQGQAERLAALSAAIARRTDGPGRLIVTGMVVGAGVGLVVAGILVGR
jgi:uncharacterized protein YciI